MRANRGGASDEQLLYTTSLLMWQLGQKLYQSTHFSGVTPG
jgi:hypothetical protein